MEKVKNDLTQKYSKATRRIHWLSFIGILVLIPLGLFMEELEYGEQKLNMFQLHAIIGAVVLLLTIFRIFVFFKHPRPPHLKTGSSFNDKLAVWIHYSFYIVLIPIFISGITILIQSGLIEAFKSGDYKLMPEHIDLPATSGHWFFAMLLIFLIVLHIVGVIKHYLLTKENTIKRIF